MSTNSAHNRSGVHRLAISGFVTAAIALSAVATSTAAGELGVNKAKAATAKWAAEACDKDPTCVKSEARYCDRQSDFKLICVAFTIKRTESGDRVQCRTQVVVTGKPGETLKTNPRKTHCS